MFYFVTQPGWLRRLLPQCVWEMPATEKVVYFSFDDGPNEEQTPFVLDQLKTFGAKATFFCIGENAQRHPELFHRIQQEGHAVGNHSYHHPDGWCTKRDLYFDDIKKAGSLIHSTLFRPPYGRITPARVRNLQKQYGLQTIMWSITSGDFDAGTSPGKCYSNIVDHVYPGAIVLMHDSSKATKNLQYALPKALGFLAGQGYRFQAIVEGPVKEKA